VIGYSFNKRTIRSPKFLINSVTSRILIKINLFTPVSISNLIKKDLLLKAILFRKVRFLSSYPSKFTKSRTYSDIV
jgi:hypothetical protein